MERQQPLITARAIGVTFVVVLTLYVLVYQGMMHWQVRRGPWTVNFTNTPAGIPTVVVQQPSVGVTSVVFTFPEERLEATNRPGVIRFDKPNRALPYGRTMFDDLLILPGTVTLDLFGHELEFLPRALVVNRQPYAWTSGVSITLWRSNQLAPEVRQPRKKMGYTDKDAKS